MRSRFTGFFIKSKYYLVCGYIIIAMLILSATIFLPTHTFSVPPNDFMLIAWMPGQQLLREGVVDMQYPYPLWTPILMLPFVLWSPEIGAQLWFICNLLLLAASMIVIMKLLKWPVRFVTVVISSLCLGAYSPVFTSLWLGQFIFVSLFALVVLVYALRSGAWAAVGAILAFSLIKPQVTILVTAVIFGVAVWQRRWKVFVGFGVVLSVFVALAAPFAATASQILGGGVGEHLTLYLGRTSTLWGLILSLIPDSLLVATVLSCLLCGWVVYLWVIALITGQWTERIIYLIMITTIVNLLIIPYSWSYNHVLLIFPFCYAIDQTRLLQKLARIFWVAVLLALFYPISNTIYISLTSVHHSDVYQIIPVLCFLILIVALQWHVDCVSKQEGNLAKVQMPPTTQSEPGAPTSSRIPTPVPQPTLTATSVQKTYIHEFPHARVIVHYHPKAGEQLTLDHVQFALMHQVHAIELDLHYRDDGQIVANHDDATPTSPTLGQIIQRIVQQAQGDPTVNHDNRQFMLVLEPKDNDNRLFNGIVQILSSYTPYLSTAVSRGDAPRGLTVVITGEYVQHFFAQFRSSQRNRLCIVEGQDYSEEIINLSDNQTPFQWVESIQHDGERGRVNALHSGIDPHLYGTYNVRVWDCQNNDDLCIGLASGADAINTDRDQVALFKQMITDQDLRGQFPGLSIQGSQVLLTWCGAASNNLYMALGSITAAGLHFPRQILLTYFLDQMPLALAPTAALSPDNRLLIAYEGTAQQHLWYVCGMFTSIDRFLTFDGKEHRLTLPNDAGRCGSNPAVAIGRDGRMIVVYEGTTDQKIWYISGFLNAAGELVGQEYSLTDGNARRGASPAIAIDPQNHVIVTYRATDSETIWYVAGAIDDSGKIIGHEFLLTEGAARRGYTPSVAFSTPNRVIVAYQGMDKETLWYVSGTLDHDGRISGQEFSLTEGAARRGSHPTIASAATGDIVILYEGIGDQKLWYVHGQLDPSGCLVGQERLLDIGMDRG